jgi:hypothetical protein
MGGSVDTEEAVLALFVAGPWDGLQHEIPGTNPDPDACVFFGTNGERIVRTVEEMARLAVADTRWRSVEGCYAVGHVEAVTPHARQRIFEVWRFDWFQA